MTITVNINFNRLCRRDWLTVTSYFGASAAFPGWAHAEQAWPSRAIRFVVPFAPGGSSEIVARTTAVELGRALGQSVYVDNRPGGAGNVAMQEVARSEDQHTVILGHVGTLAVNPYIFDKLPYDPNKDFRPISLLAKVPSLYLVRPDLPVSNLKEFIAHAKKNPGKLNYGSAGNGSAGHLAMEYLKMVSDTLGNCAMRVLVPVAMQRNFPALIWTARSPARGSPACAGRVTSAVSAKCSSSWSATVRTRS